MNYKLAIWCIILILASCSSKKSDTLTIAAASSLQFALEDIVEAFEASSGIECTIILNSSGKLTAQIREGAPYDVFLSADLKYPLDVQQAGLAIEAPKVFAYGQLAWWSADSTFFNTRFTAKRLNSVALANPKTAPYGRAAMEVLEHLNWKDSLAQKLVFGESISQTNQFIISGAAQTGITTRSVIHADQLTNRGSWRLIDTSTHGEIPQSILIIERPEELKKKAEKFRSFLLGQESQSILKKYGYTIPKEL